MSEYHPVQQARDCLESWSGTRPIGYSHVLRKPVFVKELTDEEVIKVFEEYMQQINTVGIAGMPESWVHIFRKTYEEILETIILAD